MAPCRRGQTARGGGANRSREAMPSIGLGAVPLAAVPRARRASPALVACTRVIAADGAPRANPSIDAGTAAAQRPRV